LPGVYFFENSKKEPLYIGKSINLRSRLKQHYEGYQTNTSKSALFIPQTKTIYYKIFSNDIQAIIAESNYIKTFSPKYNSIQKDGKSNLYIVFTNPPETKVVFSRATDIQQFNLDDYNKQVFGPYTSASIATILQKQIRKTFGLCLKPFNSQNKACFNYHLKQCPGACCREISISDYQKRLGLAKKFLSGEFTDLRKHYLREIKKNSSTQNYETASRLKYEYQKLQEVLDSGNINLLLKLSESVPNTQNKINLTLNHPKLNSTPHRIECFDLAHLQGNNYVGAMTVMEDGFLKKSEYRLFHVNDSTSDPYAMKEIITRRLQHSNWKIPDLIILDGGKPQLNIVLPVTPPEIAVVALAKKRETLIYYDAQNKIRQLNLNLDDPVLNQLILLRNEAHRFGNNFHRKQRGKTMLI